MKKIKIVFRKLMKKLKKARQQERGSALVIVTLVLALLTIYVSASLMNATSDAITSNFEVAKKRAFFSAYSKLEQMTGDFSNLFLTSLTPTYDSMCRVVISSPSNVNGFDLKLPNVSCPPNSNCSPSYSGKFTVGTDLFDLGWEGDPLPPSGFCLVDVCNPSAAPVCGYPLRPTNSITIPRGDYAGLLGFARRFRMIATARAVSGSGADVQVTRDFNNYLIPAFQFGIFSDTDFELYIPPPWTFGGWVHTNGNFYATGDYSGGTVRNVFRQYKFDASGNMVADAAKITIVKHLIIGREKSGASTSSGDFIRVYTSPTAYTDVSVGTSTAGAKNPTPTGNCGSIPTSLDTPDASCPGTFNPSNLDPTLKVGVRPLRLPIQNVLGLNAVELIKRGLPSDFTPGNVSPLLSARYYYKPGIRITLADYQNQLPRTVQAGDNPSSGSGPYGGIQLDDADPWLAENVGSGTSNLIRTGSNPSTNPLWYYMDGKTTGVTNDKWPLPRGYQPKVKTPSTGVARPTGARVNGSRVHGWIKIEIVKSNGQTLDITEEILNLGVTVPYQANTTTTYYYPRSTPGFPGTLPLDISGTNNGPYPDENSVIHLQRLAVPYITSTEAGVTMPSLNDSGTFSAPLDDVSSVVPFDYYASMALKTYNNTTIKMYGIEDDYDTTTTHLGYTTRNDGTTNAYSEPQPDPGGYYTDATNVSAPRNNPLRREIDFTGTAQTTRQGSETANIYSPAGTAPLYGNGTGTGTTNLALSENVNLPKNKTDKVLDAKTRIATTSYNADGSYLSGETTWQVRNNGGVKTSLIPFPINMYDSREGVPHESDSTTGANKPVPGIQPNAVSKNGVMNLIEIDMGNLGRLLRGDFDNLFAQMGTTAYKTATGVPLKAASALTDFSDVLHENIKINQDNGWIIYVSDRRGDEPLISTNPNLKTPSGQYQTTPSFSSDPKSVIGDGTYNRENVIWSAGGSVSGGSASALNVKYDAGSLKYGCDNSFAPVKSDNQDNGKSPQDSNVDCFIFNEDSSGQYSETAPYSAYFNEDQSLQANRTSGSDLVTYSTSIDSGTNLRGALVAMTQVATVAKQTWSYKPPVAYRDTVADTNVEIFRRGVRLVNADTLFPTGIIKNTTIPSNPTNIPVGITIGSENPVYVFGNYNAPAGTGVDTDQYPGISGNPAGLATPGTPTSLQNYNGQTFSANCTSCHVPSSIISDAVTFLSGACVGTKNTNWSGTNGQHGWLDTRSFVSPYQALGIRTARNTVYRFGLIAGYTSGWYPTFWGDSSGTNHQGSESAYSSGGLNNFPRFLEDWGQNGNGQQFAIYGGSLIRAYRSQQGNGAFKRNSSASTYNSDVDYVYSPPKRDWVFDLDFSRPATLPPGTPFLQLVDFKGFQESSVQERE